MKISAYWFSMLLLACLATACTTGTLSLQSTPPGAKVRARALSGGDWKELGETPLVASATSFRNPAGVGSGPLLLEFRKEGYAPMKSVVGEAATGDISLSVELEQQGKIENPDRLNAILDRIFESQALAHGGRYDDALEKLRNLEQEAPQLSAIYELEGGIYYLQKKYREALDAYNLAVKINPNAIQATKMRQVLESVVRKGAGP